MYKKSYIVITYDTPFQGAYFTEQFTLVSPLQLDLSALNLEQLQKFSEFTFELQDSTIRKWKIIS